MYGSNYLGQPYYGQGPAVGTTFILASVSTTVTVLAAISSKLLINFAVSATVTASASINRLIKRLLSGTVTTTADITSRLVEGLNVRNAITKFLNMYRSTNALDGDNETKLLSTPTATRAITTDE